MLPIKDYLRFTARSNTASCLVIVPVFFSFWLSRPTRRCAFWASARRWLIHLNRRLSREDRQFMAGSRRNRGRRLPGSLLPCISCSLKFLQFQKFVLIFHQAHLQSLHGNEMGHGCTNPSHSISSRQTMELCSHKGMNVASYLVSGILNTVHKCTEG